MGEYVDGKYVNGVIRKPLLSSKIRIINNEELIILAYYDLKNNNQLKWNKIALILNKNKDFIVFEYLN